MEQAKIDRINALARKAKTDGLTESEKEEQRVLRGEYLAAIKASMTNTLEHTYIQYPDGRKVKLERKNTDAATKQEKSCGALIFRDHNGVPETLLLRHVGGHWAFAKGHVEGEEQERETALREIREETGLEVQLDESFRHTTTYSPCPGVTKEVVYFLAKPLSGEETPQLEEISELCWCRLEEALDKVTYENDRAILREAMHHLENRNL